MMTSGTATSTGARRWSASGPIEWVTAPSHRRLLVAVSGVMFAAVTVLRWYLEHSGQDAGLLYVLPVSLVALAVGRQAGLVAATVGSALFAAFAIFHGVGDLDFTGWTAPIFTMYLVGVVLGDVCERAREREEAALILEERRRLLEELCERQEHALRVSDQMVQAVAAARWLIDAGRTAEALDSLTAAVSEGIAELTKAMPASACVPVQSLSSAPEAAAP